MLTSRTIFARPPGRPGTYRRGYQSDARNPDPFGLASPWFLSQAAHVIGVAGEQDDWSGLGQSDHGQ
jgi:hypothetical protein